MPSNAPLAAPAAMPAAAAPATPALPATPVGTFDAVAALWHAAALPAAALARLELPGEDAVLPSSFAVATAAQASLGAATLAAATLGALRTPGAAPVRASVERLDAAAETTCRFSIDQRVPPLWDPVSGLYPCGGSEAPGFVRIHANFAHHRDGALRLLGLPTGGTTTREAVARALRGWRAIDFEDAAAAAGLVVAAARSFDDWDRHPQGLAVAALPTVSIERIGGAPPIALPAAGPPARPLHGLRVLDLTRILAGPVAGRTLAACGADVLLLNAPSLPNIDAIADTSRGKRSAHLDLRTEAGRDTMRTLVRGAHVVQQGYRPGALEALGFGPEALARLRPGIVCVSLSAYGHAGPWAGRRGFDSLVQTATGFNLAEAQAAGEAAPKAMPVQIVDFASGWLMAFGALAALHRQATEGGSWHVRVSLAGTGRWLRGLGRVADGLSEPARSFEDRMVESDSGFGRLAGIRCAPRFDGLAPGPMRPSMPPGTHAPDWSGFDDTAGGA